MCGTAQRRPPSHSTELQVEAWRSGRFGVECGLEVGVGLQRGAKRKRRGEHLVKTGQRMGRV